MPDEKTVQAWVSLIKAAKAFFTAVGPGWSLALGIFAVLALFAFYFLRQWKNDSGWQRTVAAKDEMIEQLNEQNRELRVEILVLGGRFTKEEAVDLVYGGSGERRGRDQIVRRSGGSR